MDIATYIKDLLCRYNEVVVPNLGAFEWRYFPAKIDAIEHQILPPSYKLFFNIDRSHDQEQLLIAHVAAKKEMDKSSAQEAIVEYRLKLEKELLNNKEVELEGLGKITVDSRGKATFTPHEAAKSWAISPASGLPILSCSPILRDKSYLVPITTPTTKKKKRRISPILIISLVVLALAAGSTPFWIHRAFPQLFAKQETTKESSRSILPLLTETQENLLELISAYRKLPFITIETNEPLAEETKDVEYNASTEVIEGDLKEVEEVVEATVEENTRPEPKTEPVSPPPSSTTIEQGDYIIVIGVFGVQSNVDRNARLVEEAGYRTQLKPLANGLTRVAAVVNCSSQQELQEKWANIRNQFTANAWIAEQ